MFLIKKIKALERLININTLLADIRKEKMMQQVKVSELKPHPRNNEFFDDIGGEKWIEFLESIKTSGVIEPIVITPGYVIVSGHQRVRACKELGIDTVLCEMHGYKNEDEIIKDLLETNIRQRGNVGGSAKKVGLRIKELERLYGIKHGNNQHDNNRIPNYSESSKSLKTQEDLAKEMGISVDTLKNYKQLTEMIPELEDLVDTGIVTKTTALAMMKNLSEKEQEELISSMDTTKRITQSQVKKYIDEIKELKSRPPVIETVTVEPDDYKELKNQLKGNRKDIARMNREYYDKVTEVNSLKEQIEEMKKSTLDQEYTIGLKNKSMIFRANVLRFIEENGGYVYLSEHITEVPEQERNFYIRAAKEIYSWANTLLYNIKQNMENKN